MLVADDDDAERMGVRAERRDWRALTGGFAVQETSSLSHVMLRLFEHALQYPPILLHWLSLTLSES